VENYTSTEKQLCFSRTSEWHDEICVHLKGSSPIVHVTSPFIRSTVVVRAEEI